MLVWKTQTLNVIVASLRYRCLLPLRYLNQRGVRSRIVPGAQRISLTSQTQAVIFVKSFREEDVESCEQAYQLGVPIILDLCDNIFIDEYAAQSNYVPAQNFRLMAQRAAAIVTTGSAMKAEVEKVLAAMNAPRLVVVIPDGNESLDDIEYAFRTTRWQRLGNLIKRKLSKKILGSSRILRRLYRPGKRRLKVIFYGIKGTIGKGLRHFNLLAPLPDKSFDSLDTLGSLQLTAQPSDSADLSINNGFIKNSSVDSSSIDSSSTNSVSKSAAIAPNLTRSPIQRLKQDWLIARPKRWPQAAPGVKTVLWFGNQGAKYGNFGMINILDVATALENVSQKQPLRLMVVSNSYEKYSTYIAPLPFETDYLPWHPRKIYDYIRASDAVIIPNSQSVFSICKSANRAVLALSQGVPVIASRTPALEIFADCVWLDDWEEGLQSYLLQPEIAQAHVAHAQQLIAQHLSGEAIAQQWLSLLNDIKTQSRNTLQATASPASTGSEGIT